MLALVQCEIDITGPVIAGTYRAVANLLNMKQTIYLQIQQLTLLVLDAVATGKVLILNLEMKFNVITI